MDFEIPYEIKELQKELRRFIKDEIKPLQDKHMDENGTVPEAIRKQVRKRSRELEFYGIDFPESVGGGGLDILGMSILREEIGKSGVILAQAVFGEFGALQSILLECNDQQKEKYLTPSLNADKLSCFALTEPNAGSDAASMETTAVKDGDQYILNGTKHYISNAPYADFAIVFAVTDPAARTGNRISCFLVDKGTPGFTNGRVQKNMADADRVGELFFNDCQVPAENLLGEEGKGFKLAMGRVGQGRIRLSSEFLGSADLCLRLSIDHAKSRVQFGKPIGQNQFIQQMLVEMAVGIHSCRMMLYHAAWKASQGKDVSQETSMLKLATSEIWSKSADYAVQIHGGMGVMQESLVASMYQMSRVARIGEGTSEVQKMLLAKHLLK